MNHASPGSGTENANCKETSRKQRVSCNHEVSNADDFYAISAASEFFTADELALLVGHPTMGLSNDVTCNFPVTQREHGDVIRLSIVHVNRALKQPREAYLHLR